MPPAEEVPRALGRRHLAKAEEFIVAARDAFSGKLLDATVSSAALAGIAAVDAYMVTVHGIRSRGDHREAVKQLRVHGGPSVAEHASALARLVSRKTTAQYGDRRSTATEAADALTRAERLVGWAREVMSREGKP